ncbi:MAG: hypothetical protein JSS81_04460 [Acidobacteria bacterium]|nr:hypothetical protein [Acidobacteriota bacterium]
MKIINLRSVLKTLPLLIAIFLSAGCSWIETVESTKIRQSEIAQHYTVRANRDQTIVSAYFQQGNWGKSVDLDAPSRIEDNGRELSQSSLNILGVSYGVRIDSFEAAHSFVYTNNDGRIFRNELTVEPLEITAEEVAVNRSQETRIALSRAVGDDEKITVSLKSELTPPAGANTNARPKKPVEDYEISLNNELDATRTLIVLKPKNLKNFVIGKAVLTVETSRELPLRQQNPAGGKMSWSYSSTRSAGVAN